MVAVVYVGVVGCARVWSTAIRVRPRIVGTSVLSLPVNVLVFPDKFKSPANVQPRDIGAPNSADRLDRLPGNVPKPSRLDSAKTGLAKNDKTLP